MVTVLVAIFILAYAAIALEHPLKINKSASALVGAGMLWTVYAIGLGAWHSGCCLQVHGQCTFFKPNKGLVSWAKYSLQVAVLGG
jgi:hypothetical protein